MKKNQPLLEAELVTLQQAQKNSNKDYFRNHCLAIELRLSRNKSVAYMQIYCKLEKIRCMNG